MGQGGVAQGKKNAARLKAWLVFVDEAGFMMAPLVRRTWAPSGRTPILLQRTRSHQKVSAIAALAVSPTRNRVHCCFRLHPDTNIDTPLVVDFLRQLDQRFSSPVILIWDRLQAHKSKAVKEFLRRNPKFHTVLLPSYAPELNPVEYAWGYLKMNPLANHALHTVDDLTSVTRKSTSSLQRNENLLRSFIEHSPLSLRLK